MSTENNSLQDVIAKIKAEARSGDIAKGCALAGYRNTGCFRTAKQKALRGAIFEDLTDGERKSILSILSLIDERKAEIARAKLQAHAT